MAAFSDTAFGRNTAFSDLAFSFAAIAPIVPVIPVSDEVRSVGGVGRHRKLEEEDALYRRRMEQRFEVQNRDDLEVVRLLTEFLSRM